MKLPRKVTEKGQDVASLGTWLALRLLTPQYASLKLRFLLPARSLHNPVNPLGVNARPTLLFRAVLVQKDNMPGVLDLHERRDPWDPVESRAKNGIQVVRCT